MFDGAFEPLERDVMDPEDDEAGFDAFASWLRSIRGDDDGQVSLAVALVDRIAGDSSITSVERLASVAGLGARALQRLFRDCRPA